MVPFAGYGMPVQYSDLTISQSTLHTRHSASLFDVSHMGQLVFRGADRVKFLEHIVVGSVKPLKDMQCKYSLMLNTRGGIIDDLILMNRSVDDVHYVVINAGRITEDIEHIDEQLSAKKSQGWDVSYEFIRDHELMALQGPKAVDVMSKLVSGFDFNDLKFFYSQFLDVGGIKCQVSRTGYTGEDGFEVAVPSDRALDFVEMMLENDAVKLAGLGARDALRLEAGLCLHGNDIGEDTTPNEADLMWTMSKKRKESGGFIGYDVVAQQMRDGPTRKRVGMQGLKKTMAPRTEMKVYDSSKENEIGVVTSGAHSPCLELPIAMGYLKTDAANVGDHVEIAVRPGKTITAEIVKLPFVPKGYFQSK
jgi:aminomethyltransferase